MLLSALPEANLQTGTKQGPKTTNQANPADVIVTFY